MSAPECVRRVGTILLGCITRFPMLCFSFPSAKKVAINSSLLRDLHW